MFAPDLANYTLLLSHSDAAGEIYVAVSDDRLSVRLAMKTNDAKRKHTIKTIKKLLVMGGVVAKIDEPLIENMIDSLREPFSATDYVQIAKGSPAVDGENSCLRPLFSAVNGEVARGAELATVVPPTKGRNGVDVFGGSIPCKPGAAVALRLGANVAREAGTNRIIATLAGFAVVVGSSVAVSPIFQVKVSDDKFQATVSFEGAGASYEDLIGLLNSVGIVCGIQEDALRGAIAGGTQANARTTVTAAEGVKPVVGKNAEVEFFFARKPSWETIDRKHWKIQQKNILAMFDAGEKLLRINPAIKGTPGKNILGEELPIGTVHDVVVKPGDNVIAEETVGGFVYLGKKRGAPVFHGNVLDVVDEYVVAGDLQQDSGYIQFGGDVIINGDVLSGSSIYSESNIVVKGAVYDAALKADGNIVVSSGVSGARTGKIICGGSLTAKYLDNCCVEAKGDVIIANEIIASDICCLGAVHCPAGVIYGGEVVALKGIQAKYIGNANCIQTTVIPGKDYTLPPVIKLIEAEMSALRDERGEINEQLQYYKDNPSVMATMPVQQRAGIKAQLLRLNEITSKLDENSQRIKEIKRCESAAGVREVSVGKTIYPGVHFEIGSSFADIKEHVSGPVKVIEDGKILFASH